MIALTCVVALGNNGLLVLPAAVSPDGTAAIAALGAVPGVNAADEATGGTLYNENYAIYE